MLKKSKQHIYYETKNWFLHTGEAGISIMCAIFVRFKVKCSKLLLTILFELNKLKLFVYIVEKTSYIQF